MNRRNSPTFFQSLPDPSESKLYDKKAAQILSNKYKFTVTIAPAIGQFYRNQQSCS